MERVRRRSNYWKEKFCSLLSKSNHRVCLVRRSSHQWFHDHRAQYLILLHNLVCRQNLKDMFTNPYQFVIEDTIMPLVLMKHFFKIGSIHFRIIKKSWRNVSDMNVWIMNKWRYGIYHQIHRFQWVKSGMVIIHTLLN